MTAPHHWTGCNVDVEVGRNPTTHAQSVITKERQAVACGVGGSDNAGKEGSGLGIDSEGLDLEGQLNDEVGNREEEIKEGEPRKGNPVPLEYKQDEADLY